MLDATEDGNNERSTLSKKEGSTEAIKANVGNRMVYKLVKVGDDGSVLAATEDDIYKSLGGLSDNKLSFYNPDGSDIVEDDDNEEGSEYFASEGNDSSRNANIIPIQDLAVERQRLMAQIDVLDCILMKVDLEEKRLLSTKKEVVEKVEKCCEGNSSTNVNANNGFGDYKRQRRPNPKYFDYDIGDDSLMGPPLTSIWRESMPKPLSSQKPYRNTIVVSPRVASGWGFHRNSGHATTLHRTKPIVLQKPFIQTRRKNASTCDVVNIVAKDNNTMSLDNLSIRELHEAFCATYGRETSVKDKHWLKRQISAGWMREQDVVIRSNSHQQVQNKFKVRLDCVTQAEQPLPTIVPLSVEDATRNVANERQFQKANDIEHFRNAFKNRLGNRCFQHRVTTPTIFSRGGSFEILAIGSLNGLSAPNGQTTIYREVVNNGDVVEDKRQRKPNRRYVEDEAYVASKFVPIHNTRSSYRETQGVELKSTINYTWRTLKTNSSLDIIGRHGIVRRTNLENICSKKFSPIQRPKLISSGMKRNVGGRAAKLVKMAHTKTQVEQHDTKVTICKDQFQLSTIQKIIPSGIGDVHRESRDWAPTVLPIVQFHPLAFVQPLVLDSRGESEEVIITVPTANGGTRRKHHKPWTLREVMTLVEGVARCGGGKWANIKKQAFSTIEYRTAVDLKDKWRNLLRASRAQFHPAKQGERKKQFTIAIPAPILARVRELASLSNQIPSSTFSMSSTSRSGRIVHRK